MDKAVKKYTMSAAFLFLLMVVVTEGFINTIKCHKKNGNSPKPGSLCRAYYVCKYWIPVKEEVCPQGQHFNAIKGWCVWAELYPCLEKPLSKECPKPNGRFLKPGTKCKSYFECCNGKPRAKRCPKHQLFSSDSGTCDWEELVTCDKEISTESSSSELSSKESSEEAFSRSTSHAYTISTTSANTRQQRTTTIKERFSESPTDGTSTGRITRIYFSSPQTEQTSTEFLTKRPSSDFISQESTINFQSTQTSPDLRSKSTSNDATVDVTFSSLPTIYRDTTEISDTTESTFSNPTIYRDTTEISDTTENTFSNPTIYRDTTEISDTTENTFSSPLTTLSIYPDLTELTSASTGITEFVLSSKPGDLTTVDPDTVDFVCPEPTGYFPHPTNKHKFIGCSHDIPSVFDCPSNLIYNDKYKRCVYSF